jgi:hypothetical protein
MSDVGYNPSDPVQQSFLQALALGETGSSSYAATEGVGGVNLAGSATDQYGFPLWNGQGNSHAAGPFQFQPSTWDTLAAQYGLNFANQADQNAGAWYLAQQTYSANNGGASLEAALQSGNYQAVQQSLASIWPSVLGNASAPQGLAASLTSGAGSSVNIGSDAAAPVNSGSSSSNGGTGPIATIENFFVRFGLIILGGVIVIVALWQLLANQGVVPSPKETAKGIAGAFAA